MNQDRGAPASSGSRQWRMSKKLKSPPEKRTDDTESSGLIYGINPVMEALREEGLVEKIIVARGRSGDDLRKILESAKRKKIPFEFRDRSELERLAGGKSQGVAAFSRPFRYTDLADVTSRKGRFRDRLLVVIDSVSDPQNLGALIRTAYSFAADGVVIPGRRAAPVTAAAIKASAGAAQHIPVSRVTNIAQSLDELKKAGFWVYGAEARAGRDLRELDYSGDIALVLGSEGEGIRELVKKKCDFLVSIPMPGGLDSLNVSVAAGIILHEIARKRV